MTDEERRAVERLLVECLELPPGSRERNLAERGVAQNVADEVLRLLEDRGHDRGDSQQSIRYPSPATKYLLQAGELFANRFRIQRFLGAGGMGQVYRARDTLMGRIVAIKVVSERFSARFKREVRALAAVNHPNICIIYDVGTNYLVMEYIAGSRLRGPLPVAKAIHLAQQIAAGLEAAHAKGIIHRDLKPGNILMTRSGVKVLDFGLAILIKRHIDPDEPTETLTGSGGPLSSQVKRHTNAHAETVALASVQERDFTVKRGSRSFPSLESQPGTVVGTPAYMSPEQAMGRALDVRSDIFSFGVVLYEMLAGGKAFLGGSARETLQSVVQKEPEPLEAVPEIRAIVARCLRKKPAERYRSVTELRLALEKAATNLADKTSSIAVLTFAVAGAEGEREYFGKGLSEDIGSALSAVAGLKVVPHTSTAAIQDTHRDSGAIAQALGVSHLLEGSVRFAGNRIRINARLIAAWDGSQSWSKRYDRELSDVFAVQDEISNAIAAELKAALMPLELVKAPTAHFAAYEAMLQGRHHFFRFDPADQTKALACFEKAVAIDPAYPAAHIGVALYHWGQMVVGLSNPRQAMERSIAAAREALRLDPANSEGHHVLASYYALHDFDWEKAERTFNRAIELNPNSLWAYHCKTIYLLLPMGRLEEALESQNRAVALDPLSLPGLVNRALVLESLRREDLEEQDIERVTRLDPNFTGGQWWLARLRARQGRLEEAREIAEHLAATTGRWGMPLAALGEVYALTGQTDAARSIIDELALEHNREYRALFSFMIASALGDIDEAFHWAMESVERRDPLFLSFIWSSSSEGMRKDPRFQALLRMLKIPKRHAPSAAGAA